MPNAREEIDAYVEAVVKEYALRISEMPEAERFPRTVYVGGGTPSILSNTALRRLIEGLQEVAGKAFEGNVAEFTIEVNPEDVSEEKLTLLRSLGVNRISMGVQTFDDPTLRLLGRNHTAKQAHAALELLSDKRFGNREKSFNGSWNYSADLIFGLPGQTLDDWGRQLTTLLDYRPPHFSAYLLSYEPGTRLYAMMLAGKVAETDEDLACEMYDLLIREAASHGYNHYEISNYALADGGAPSLHNSNYWNSTSYLGLGASAHSFDSRTRRFNPSNIKNYISSLFAGRTCFEIDDENETDRLNDCIITSLRTSAGLNLAELSSRFSPQLIHRLANAINRHRSQLEEVNTSLRIPESNWLTADRILRSLILD